MIEIRGHARGGQGMVTAFEILAKIFSRLGGYQVQAFPAFGVERTGAPIQAFLRLSKDEILNRSNVYAPHLVIVFDESLIEQMDVFSGLRPGGTALINTAKKPTDYAQFAEHVFVVPATEISIKQGLGSASLPIVNAAMMGAIMRIFQEDIDFASELIRENVPAKPEENARSARIAFSSVDKESKTRYMLPTLLAATDESVMNGNQAKKGIPSTAGQKKERPERKVPAWDQPMTINKTGNWRVVTPEFGDRPPPCTHNCPAGTDVRSFVRNVAEGNLKEAYDIIYKSNPFAATCGRVCPHFCQQSCNRISLDEELNIAGIERFLGDQFGDTEVQPAPLVHDESIAIVGSGPAGLTAALRLRQMGYSTTVFESLPKAGGMMRVGIPQFRLPEEVLDKEIDRIKQEGVEIRLNKRVSVKELEDQFDAVIVATGSHVGAKMYVENEDLALDGLQFLHEYKMNGRSFGVKPGDEVMVIGGGNTAIDVARTARRLGAKATIYYRRTKKEMPAILHEVKEAEVEGVNIKFLKAPVAITQIGQGFRVSMTKMKLGKPDASGRKRPVPIEGSETDIIVQHVIKATGQKSDPFVFSGTKLKPRHGMIDTSGDIPVFCSGDMVSGATVTEAIGSGNQIAKALNAFLRHASVEAKSVSDPVVMPDQINFAYYLPAPSFHNHEEVPKEITGNFDEVVSGLSQEEVIFEAGRCLHCGECSDCGNCINYCPDAAIYFDDQHRLRIDYDYCKGCGICFEECPCGSIQLTQEEVEYA
jgi:2-oxoacid:acceptor oxidoreductase gamma subunit (pyruvate/2-ketoisovalerate family)/2-oxoacid:acceptor oxidoreductase delta subunit (pyruvate/2-ketoisovalerate family)